MATHDRPAIWAPDCDGCPFNQATHIAHADGRELNLCECCAGAHDETDGWTITPMNPATNITQ